MRRTVALRALRDTDNHELRAGLEPADDGNVERRGVQPKARSTSALTAAKISAGAASCATSVATRSMAACLSATATALGG
jgi:hypothetical protein